MLVNPSTAVQHNSGASQSTSAASTHSGMTFTEMLTGEMHSAAPVVGAPVPPAAAQPAATPPGAASTTSSNGTSASSTGGTSSTSNSGSTQSNTKKPIKSTQTDAQSSSAAAAAAAAATAATAAALASVAAGNVRENPRDASGASGAVDATMVASAPPPAAAAAATASPTSDQLAGLAGSVAATPASAQAQEINLKNPVTGNQFTATTGANGKAVTPSIATQTTTAVNSAGASVAKNGDHPAENFEAAFGKASGLESAAAGKNSVATPIVAPTSSAPNSSITAALVVTSADSGATMQTVKSANQNLSNAQMNALAPVLSMPNANVDVASSETITPQVGSPSWDEAVGQKVSWMVAGGQQSATLTLNPPDLGPMQVVLSVSNQHASATFTSHQPEVRAALENAIPKLREMLEQSGIQLGDCNVNSQNKQQFAQNQSNSNSGSTNRGAGTTGNVSISAAISSISTASQRAGIGLVDTFV